MSCSLLCKYPEVGDSPLGNFLVPRILCQWVVVGNDRLIADFTLVREKLPTWHGNYQGESKIHES